MSEWKNGGRGRKNETKRLGDEGTNMKSWWNGRMERKNVNRGFKNLAKEDDGGRKVNL